MPMMVVVNPKVEAKTLQELVALAPAPKSRQAQLRLRPASAPPAILGLGVVHARRAKIKGDPYPLQGRRRRRRSPDLLAGQIDGVVDNPPTVVCRRSRPANLRPLAVGGKAAHAATAGFADRRRSGALPITRPSSLVRRGRAPPGHARRRFLARACTRRSPPPVKPAGIARALRQVGCAPARQHGRRNSPNR